MEARSAASRSRRLPCRMLYGTAAIVDSLRSLGMTPLSKYPDFLGSSLDIRCTMPAPRGSLLQGTLDLLVLKTLTWGPRHGYAIARWIEDTTDDALRIEEGSLYPALYRMERRGWIEAAWGKSEIGQRIKIYSLTPKGRAQLRAESAQWRTSPRRSRK